MKNIKLLAFATLAFFTAISCSDFGDHGDINDDPNSAIAVPASTLLTTAQYNFYSTLNGTGLNADFGLLMVQQWSQNEYTEDSRYEFEITDFDGTFNTMYASILKELDAAKELIQALDIDEGIKNNQVQIINIMEAQVYAVLTDGFGAVPYSEAISDVNLPKYDSQEDIYKGILATLADAASSLNTNKASFASGEVLFGGDVAKWIKFANSMMLKYAMRLADVDASTAQTYVNMALSGGVFDSNADNAAFYYPNVDARANPLYRNWAPQISNRDDYCVSDVLVDNLNAMGDPRLEMFAKPASSGTIVGLPYGLSDNDATELKSVTSRPNDNVRSATTPFMAMSYAEVEFLKAEGRARGIISGDAAAAYNAGVSASMDQWEVADMGDYLTNNPYNASNWKESIGVQKWIALYMNGFEAWNEWRRLDYPQLTPSPLGKISSIPVRLPYPLSETQSNSEQLSAVTSDPGSMTTKVWWDVN